MKKLIRKAKVGQLYFGIGYEDIAGIFYKFTKTVTTTTTKDNDIDMQGNLIYTLSILGVIFEMTIIVGKNVLSRNEAVRRDLEFGYIEFNDINLTGVERLMIKGLDTLLEIITYTILIFVALIFIKLSVYLKSFFI